MDTDIDINFLCEIRGNFAGGRKIIFRISHKQIILMAFIIFFEFAKLLAKILMKLFLRVEKNFSEFS